MKKFNYGIILTILTLLLFLLVNAAYANIVLKVILTNPSKDQVQRVPVKVYLPKETKPENIVDKGDLETSYDTQQGSYYVYGEYELEPGEAVVKDIELQDIWTVPDSEIEFLRLETIKITNLLKNTEYADRVAYLTNSIESKLNLISENQLNPAVNPERHISDYRENLKIIDSVKADIALMRNLASQVKPFPSVTIWKLMLAIIIFLGVMGTSFYFVWQKQAKLASKETFEAPLKDEELPEKAARHEAKEGRHLEPGDIEKIIKEDQE